MTGAPTLCSVIIVSFNSGSILVECVRQVLGSTNSVEILVSDNGSVDASVDQLRKAFGREKRLRIVENGENLGFSAAANRVLPMAAGDWLLFLNPDCIVEPDTLERMLSVIVERPETGMAGCVLRNPDGTEQAGCRRREPTLARSLGRIFSVTRFRRHHGSLGDFNLDSDPLPTEPVAVDAISGAFMLVRRSALERVGPLDEEYFLHCEDLDWCRRFRDAGYTVLFVPFVEVLHVKGVSSRSRPVRVEWHKHRGMLRYYRKYFREQHTLPLAWAISAGVWIRFGLLAVVCTLRRVLR